MKMMDNDFLAMVKNCYGQKKIIPRQFRFGLRKK